jgi:hypothetical protein
MQAVRAARPGGHVGYVSVAHGVELPGMDLFLLPRPPARPRTGAPLPTRTHRSDLEPADRPRQVCSTSASTLSAP